VLSERLDVDLLLTDHEESCDSTAQYHTLKNYNWIAEFDREGEDVVTYNLDSKKFLTALGDFWSIGIGAFSDICSMQTDVCCVNIGIGHQLSHSKDSYVCIKTLRKQIERFLIFYDTYKIQSLSGIIESPLIRMSLLPMMIHLNFVTYVVGSMAN